MVANIGLYPLLFAPITPKLQAAVSPGLKGVLAVGFGAGTGTC